ncbi:MAG: cupin domain-containing protein [Maritimibacter sp.]|nr:cupin domain-containing protein [Maritimibacter sp.]
MILRGRDHPALPVSAEARAEIGPAAERSLADDGGLAQFGVRLYRLDPGARSSDRHWHEREDEFLYVLDGTATVVDDAGPHDLGPGDACAWPAGEANGHHVVNRSHAPCSFLVVGTRAATDTVHYADIDKIRIRHEDGREDLIRRDGSPFVEPQQGD